MHVESTRSLFKLESCCLFYQVDSILNSAAEVTANATAQSQLIAAKSQADYVVCR